ncbi:type II toxin-antitoxin system VapC family toxin [soil metagenome]
MNFVLDASIALAWCFIDEATPFTNSLLESLEANSAFVPAIWSLEVGNILIVAERRKRISYARIAEFLAILAKINIQVDIETATRGFHETLALAHSEKLTTYDASYLELAMRLGLPLASKDRQLCDVAKQVGVQVLTD